MAYYGEVTNYPYYIASTEGPQQTRAPLPKALFGEITRRAKTADLQPKKSVQHPGRIDVKAGDTINYFLQMESEHVLPREVVEVIEYENWAAALAEGRWKTIFPNLASEKIARTHCNRGQDWVNKPVLLIKLKPVE